MLWTAGGGNFAAPDRRVTRRRSANAAGTNGLGQDFPSGKTFQIPGALGMIKSLLIGLSGLLAGAALASAVTRGKFIYPKIQGHGQVVRLETAAEPPRSGSKLCVDVTRGGPHEAINPALEKLARYVNIYAGAGKEPADARITVVLHGQATFAALSHDAYRQRFDIARNPNLLLLGQLRQAGVELLVCGQSAAANSIEHSDIAEPVQLAVSALTVNVNRQADGYAYIPLH